MKGVFINYFFDTKRCIIVMTDYNKFVYLFVSY